MKTMLIPLAIAALLQAAAPALAQPADRGARPVVSKGQPAGDADGGKAYWYDGGTRRELRIDTSQVADFADAATAAPRGHPQMRKSSEAAPRGKSSPVFRNAGAPRSALRALPGGIIVTLHAPGSAEQANQALAPFGMRVARAVDSSGLRWVVATEAGMPALEAANRLHESGAFAGASPDWWVGITKK